MSIMKFVLKLNKFTYNPKREITHKEYQREAIMNNNKEKEMPDMKVQIIGKNMLLLLMSN
jgi:hypothetical protein